MVGGCGKRCFAACSTGTCAAQHKLCRPSQPVRLRPEAGDTPPVLPIWVFPVQKARQQSSLAAHGVAGPSSSSVAPIVEATKVWLNCHLGGAWPS